LPSPFAALTNSVVLFTAASTLGVFQKMIPFSSPFPFRHHFSSITGEIDTIFFAKNTVLFRNIPFYKKRYHFFRHIRISVPDSSPFSLLFLILMPDSSPFYGSALLQNKGKCIGSCKAELS
jgi:hypothetical protein